MPGRSVTIKCICEDRFNVAASQVPMPFTGAKTLACPNCAGEWRLAWDHRTGEIRMLPPEQTHKPAEWGFKPRPTREEIESGEVWAGPEPEPEKYNAVDETILSILKGTHER